MTWCAVCAGGGWWFVTREDGVFLSVGYGPRVFRSGRAAWRAARRSNRYWERRGAAALRAVWR